MNVRIAKIIARLTEEYSTPRTILQFTSPLELLIATILSAQCTDERVNRVTPRLFQKYKTPEDYVHTDLTVLEQIIRPTGYYRRKAKLIQDCCQQLMSDFKSRVPQTMEELLTLPGVARKTANIVLSNAFGIVVGIAVDTHVKRLSQRLGFTRNKNPDKIEKDLGWVPQETFESGIEKTIKWYLENTEWCKHVQDGSYQRERLGIGDSQDKEKVG